MKSNTIIYVICIYFVIIICSWRGNFAPCIEIFRSSFSCYSLPFFLFFLTSNNNTQQWNESSVTKIERDRIWSYPLVYHQPFVPVIKVLTACWDMEITRQALLWIKHSCFKLLKHSNTTQLYSTVTTPKEPISVLGHESFHYFIN